MRRAVVIGLLPLLGMASPAGAACRWTQDCTSGLCKPISLCERSYDTPGAMTGDSLIPRVVPPRVAPVMTPIVPPPGALHCSQRNICSHGNCGWQPICE
jgi:hypothetical protein